MHQLISTPGVGGRLRTGEVVRPVTVKCSSSTGSLCLGRRLFESCDVLAALTDIWLTHGTGSDGADRTPATPSDRPCSPNRPVRADTGNVSAGKPW